MQQRQRGNRKGVSDLGLCRDNRLGLIRPESLVAETLSLTKEGALGAGGTARGRPLRDLNNAKDFKDVAFTFELLAASWTTISPTVFTAQAVCGLSTLHKTRQHFAKTRREAGSPRHRDSIPSRLATLACRFVPTHCPTGVLGAGAAQRATVGHSAGSRAGIAGDTKRRKAVGTGVETGGSSVARPFL